MKMYTFLITGTVQGVGFRPYIYNACIKKGMKGYVKNIGQGVEIGVNNKEALQEILDHLPPLAHIDEVTIDENKGVFEEFSILPSEGEGFAPIPADLFMCEDCYEELNDPKNRRYGYFFITCTNCGPRYTMTQKTPYDRKNTTMNNFPMCRECTNEYRNPKSRRYHAQTIACHECGPRMCFTYQKKEVKGNQIKNAVEAIRKGEVVAIKGVGGYHLVCKTDKETVHKLRTLTGRKNKPYALMVKGIKEAEKLVNLNEIEKQTLKSKERPILVAQKKDSKQLMQISELNSLGIILPYTPLHYLLFKEFNEPLVMTSSNMVDEPITNTKKQQLTNYILSHNRIIENPADDSIVKVIEKKRFLLRRSRGYIPDGIITKKNEEETLALGAEINSCFSIYKQGAIMASVYLGNTSNHKVFEHYKKTIGQFLIFTKTKPKIILTDMHPRYNTSEYAEGMTKEQSLQLKKIQHHKAHAYAAALEHNLKDFVAIVCDGLGYGEDGTIWGGEIFHNHERIGHLEKQKQLGGDKATMKPSRMTFSILRNFLTLEETKKYLQEEYTEKELNILDKQLQEEFNTPITTSCGRIIDAASFLLGFCREKTYEARPALLLEANSTHPYEIEPVIQNNTLMTTPLFEYIIKNFDKDKKRLAATVQIYLAKGLYQIAKQYNKTITFSGGCAYNTIMSGYLIKKGVLVNEKIPAGDGGISVGQIAYYLANTRNNTT